MQCRLPGRISKLVKRQLVRVNLFLTLPHAFSMETCLSSSSSAISPVNSSASSRLAMRWRPWWRCLPTSWVKWSAPVNPSCSLIWRSHVKLTIPVISPACPLKFALPFTAAPWPRATFLPASITASMSPPHWTRCR